MGIFHLSASSIPGVVGLFKFIKPDPPSPRIVKLDWIGLISLAISIASIQLVLDRGGREDWFSSVEIILEGFFLSFLVGFFCI